MANGSVPHQRSSSQPTRPMSNGARTSSTARVMPSPNPLLIFRLVARSDTGDTPWSRPAPGPREIVKRFAIYGPEPFRGKSTVRDRRRGRLATPRVGVPNRETGRVTRGDLRFGLARRRQIGRAHV